MSTYAYTACVIVWMACMAAAFGCMVGWAFNMLVDGNRNEKHLYRAGGFIVAGVAAGFLATQI